MGGLRLFPRAINGAFFYFTIYLSCVLVVVMEIVVQAVLEMHTQAVGRLAVFFRSLRVGRFGLDGTGLDGTGLDWMEQGG